MAELSFACADPFVSMRFVTGSGVSDPCPF
jgi:hypothetical protein